MNSKNNVVEIDLNNKEITEGVLLALGSAIKSILRALFGNYSIPVNIKGTKPQVESFINVLSSEKDFLNSFKNYGLDNPNVYRNKYKLNKAISEFERKTNLPWPFKS